MEINLTYIPPKKLTLQLTEAKARTFFEIVFRSITGEFQFLPEYNQVIKWLTNNDGKGIALIGSNGRGKSIIARYVIPNIYLSVHRKVIKPVDALQMNDQLESLLKKKFISIDDVGTEDQRIVFGERRWAFPEIVDKAEKENNILIVTTNLGAQAIEEKYGIRTRERLRAVCSQVVFKGQSLRK